jgi:hypothetical protein
VQYLASYIVEPSSSKRLSVKLLELVNSCLTQR